MNTDNNHKCLLSIKSSVISEDWSNDAENHRNKSHFTVYSHRKHLYSYNISLFSSIFHW